MASRAYPPEWIKQVPAEVFASLIPNEIRILVHPGLGIASGGARYDLPIEAIPFELRVPNTAIWVQLDQKLNVVRVWKRETAR